MRINIILLSFMVLPAWPALSTPSETKLQSISNEKNGLTGPGPKAVSSSPPALIYAFEVTPRYFIGVNDIHQSVFHPDTGDRSFANYLAPIADSDYGALYLHADLKMPYRSDQHSGHVHVEMDTGEIYRGVVSTSETEAGEPIETEGFLANEQSLEDEFLDSYFIRQLHIEHTVGSGRHLTLGIGKGNPVVGHGLIYNDYSPYVRLRLNSRKAWKVPMELDSTLLSPGASFVPEDSLLWNVEWAVKPTGWGRLSLYMAHLRDRTDSVAESFRQIVTASANSGAEMGMSPLRGRTGQFNRLTTFASTSDVSWFGGGYSRHWSAGHSVWLNGCVNVGRAAVTMDMGRYLASTGRSPGRPRGRTGTSGAFEIDLELMGAAGQMGGSIFLGRDWYLSGFAIAMTGDEGLAGVREFFRTGLQQGQVDQRFGGFLSVVPYLDHTSIFFNGGLDQGFSYRQSSVAGLVGRGVLATGLSVTGTVWGPISFTGGPALLYAMHDGPQGRGRSYGIELDNILTWTIGRGLSASAEVDFLRTGDFFPETAWTVQTTLQVSYAPSGTF